MPKEVYIKFGLLKSRCCFFLVPMQGILLFNYLKIIVLFSCKIITWSMVEKTNSLTYK